MWLTGVPKNKKSTFLLDKMALTDPVEVFPNFPPDRTGEFYCVVKRSAVFGGDCLEPYSAKIGTKRQGTTKTSYYSISAGVWKILPKKPVHDTGFVSIMSSYHGAGGIVRQLYLPSDQLRANYNCVLFYAIETSDAVENVKAFHASNCTRKRLLKSTANAIRDLLPETAQHVDRTSRKLKNVKGLVLNRQQIHDIARRKLRYKTKRGKQGQLDIDAVVRKAIGGAFVKAVDCRRSFRIVMFRRCLVKRWARDCFIKTGSVWARRSAVRGAILNVKRPNSATIGRLLSVVQENPLRGLSGTRSEVDTTFNYGGCYLTTLIYKSTLFQRKGKSLLIPIGFMLHKQRRAVDYSFFFNSIYEEVSNTLGSKDRILPSLCTDDCGALSKAIRDCPMFRGTKHLLCVLHIKRNLILNLKRAGKKKPYIKNACRVILGSLEAKQGRSSRLLSSLDLAEDMRLRYIRQKIGPPSNHPQLWKWIRANKNTLAKADILARLGGQDRIAPVTSNLIEGFHSDLPLIAPGGNDVLHSINQLEEYTHDILDIEQQLCESAKGEHPDVKSRHQPANPILYAGSQDLLLLEQRLTRSVFDAFCEKLSYEIVEKGFSSAAKAKLAITQMDDCHYVILEPSVIINMTEAKCSCTKHQEFCIHIAAVLAEFGSDKLVNIYMEGLSHASANIIREKALPTGSKTRRTGTKLTRQRAETEDFHSPERFFNAQSGSEDGMEMEEESDSSEF